MDSFENCCNTCDSNDAICKCAAINLSTEVVKFQREVEQKASHIGSAVCQVILVASARPSYYEAGNKLACPLGKTGSWHQEHMQQHLIATPPPQQTWLPGGAQTQHM